MRTVTHGDVVAVAMTLVDLPEQQRRAQVMRVIEQAHLADIYRKRTGRAHPNWGNGSLMAAACQVSTPHPEPFLSEARYLEAIAAVIETVLEWRHRAT